MASSKLSPGDQFVTCIDGPKAGMWWFQTDWDDAVAAAEHMQALDGRARPVQGYVPAGQQVKHPDTATNPDVYATAYRYTEPPIPRRTR